MLLLTSSGIEAPIKPAFVSLLTKPANEVKVCFITTAAYGESKNPTWMEKDRGLLQECGIKHIEDLDIKDKTQSELEKIIADKDIIYVNGGNTFYLLYWVRKSGFDSVVSKYVKRGGLYVGVSAGSYVVCPTIEAATWKHSDRNKVGLEDLTALSLVPFLITAHFEEKYRKIVEAEAKKIKYPIVALADGQAVLVEGKEVKLIGKGERNFYNRFRER